MPAKRKLLDTKYAYTVVQAAKTIGEIEELLYQMGDLHVSKQVVGGEVVALYFTMPFGPNNEEQPVRVPVDIDAMQDALRRANIRPKTKATPREQAYAAAWRRVKHWVEAQIMLIEVGMATPQEVFLPWACTAGIGSPTFYELIEERGVEQLLLPAPTES